MFGLPLETAPGTPSEALIDQKLADDDYNRVTANLAGLKNVLQDYKQAYDNYAQAYADHEKDSTKPSANPTLLLQAWTQALIDFDLYQPNFQQNKEQVLLLPLFAQFANMYLSLLRDVLLPSKQNPSVVNGKDWGLSDKYITDYSTKLTDKISEFTTYTNSWYVDGRGPLAAKPIDVLNVEPFRSTNAYDRNMTSLVLDYVDTWQYYDLTKYPNGAQNPDGTNIPLMTREIYSDPYGNLFNYNHDNRTLVLPAPATQFPTQLTVWGGKYIGAVQLTYRGPNGVLTTPRMGDQNSGNPNTFYPTADKPIRSVLVTWDYAQQPWMVINTLQFTLDLEIKDNFPIPIVSPQLGSEVGQYQANVGYDGYALSSIYIDGVSEQLGQYANCIVFGFMRWPRQ